MPTKAWAVLVMRAITILCLASLVGVMAFAQAPAGPNRPAGVPKGYVITPFGYFHPSCVHRLAEGDSFLGNGLTVQHTDGTLTTFPACDYPRFTASGEKIAADAKVQPPTISHSWIVAGNTTTSSSYGEGTATWTVPPAPTSSDGQTIYFFPGFQDYNGGTTIIQPVLGWNSDFSNAWGIASWNCCPGGTTDESAAVAVNAGDQIFGDTKSTCAAGTLTCATWNITTKDVTLSKSTTLANTPNEGQTFNWAFGGVLEVYGITQCSDYPPNGALTFDATLYDNNFQVISNPGWYISNWASGLTPQCNYGGQIANPLITLTYGGPLATVTTYTGATAGQYGMPVTLSAVLTDQIGGGGLANELLTFQLGSQHCTGLTNGSGAASCSLTLNQTPGGYTVTATFGGDSNYNASSGSAPFTINKALTSLNYTGSTMGDYNDLVSLSAVLTSAAGPLAGMNVSFTIGSQSCMGTTSATGTAQCSLTLNQIPGSYTVVTNFAGNANYIPSSVSTGFTITREETVVSYTGATTGDYHDPVTLAGTLTIDGTSPLASQTLTFTIGTQSCTGVTSAAGAASCTLTLNQASGPYTVTASYGGSAYFLPSSGASAFAITREQTTLSYTGPVEVTNGGIAHLSGVLLEDGTIAISGRLVTFVLGTGLTAQTCSGTTNASGVARCTINPVAQPRGMGSVSDAFAGDAYYLPANASATTTVYGFPVGVRLSTKPNPSTVGQSVRLVAVVVPGPGTPKPPLPSTPTGTATFYDLQTPLGTVPLDGTATATLYVQFTSSGQHLITAQYSGDTYFVPNSATVAENVH